MKIDPCIHDTVDPVSAGSGDCICPIALVFAGGECGAEESVVSVSQIRTKSTCLHTEQLPIVP
jgi:hypothetical protein